MSKAKISALLSLIIGFITLSSYSQSKSQPPNGLQLHGAFTPAKAMSAIYGSYDNREGSTWKPERIKSYPEFWPDTVTVRVLFDGSYVESGVPKHMLVTGAVPKGEDFTCHQCGPLMGLIVFQKNRTGWQAESSDLQFGEYGEFGRASEVALQRLGPDHYGLLVSDSFEAQEAVTDTLTFIVPKEGRFLKALEVQTASGWSNLCNDEQEVPDGCSAYDGSFEMVPRPGAEYYDILVTKRVYRTNTNTTPEGTTTTRLRFDGSKYVPLPAGE